MTTHNCSSADVAASSCTGSVDKTLIRRGTACDSQLVFLLLQQKGPGAAGPQAASQTARRANRLS
jgi:hypothetical protein